MILPFAALLVQWKPLQPAVVDGLYVQSPIPNVLGVLRR